jgi:ribosomal protein S20
MREKITKVLSSVYSLIDRVLRKMYSIKNAASRKKSKLAAALKSKVNNYNYE